MQGGRSPDHHIAGCGGDLSWRLQVIRPEGGRIRHASAHRQLVGTIIEAAGVGLKLLGRERRKSLRPGNQPQRTLPLGHVFQRHPGSTHQSPRHGVEVHRVGVQRLFRPGSEVQGLKWDRSHGVQAAQRADHCGVGRKCPDCGRRPPQILNPIGVPAHRIPARLDVCPHPSGRCNVDEPPHHHEAVPHVVGLQPALVDNAGFSGRIRRPNVHRRLSGPGRLRRSASAGPGGGPRRPWPAGTRPGRGGALLRRLRNSPPSGRSWHRRPAWSAR